MTLLPRSIALLALLAAAACHDVVEPPLPGDALRFTPPPAYRRWWAMVESCSGRTGRMEGVAWYVVPGSTLIHAPGRDEMVRGYHSLRSNRVVLAGLLQHAGPVVRHEMLHALLRAGGHPREQFLGRCAGVVECHDDCLAGARPLPPADAGVPRVTPSALDVALEIDPATPSPWTEEGLFSLVVKATNRAPHPVVVVLPPRPLGGPPETFSYEVVADGFGVSASRVLDDPSLTRFAAGETKRQVFDFVLGSQLPWQAAVELRPGLYDFRGAFGGRRASVRPVAVLP